MGVDPVVEALSTEYVRDLIAVKANQLTRRKGFRRHEQPDIEQELAAHVVRKARLYDPTRGSVHTFIDRVVNSAAAMLCRDRRRIKRAAGYRTVSLQDIHMGRLNRHMTLEDFLEGEDLCRRLAIEVQPERQARESAMDIRGVLVNLPPAVREVWIRLAEGTDASVSREFGISRRQVRNIRAAIRRLLEESGLTEA